MARKTSIKSATWTDLEEILATLPGIPLDDARAMLSASRERFLSVDALAAHHKAHIDALAEKSPWSSFKDANAPREDFAASVFAARATRRSNESSDHTLRLSNSRNDSAAMKKFLETKSITVVPTRTAPGAGVSRRSVRAKSVTLRTGSSHNKSRAA
jgi:hypothetical protein